jgi:hypothetical protein
MAESPTSVLVGVACWSLVGRGWGLVASSADSVAIFGAFRAGQSAGDVLLDLGWSQVAFGLVRGGWHLQVVGEAQHVGLALAREFGQQSCLAFTGAGAVAGGL